MGVVWVMTPSSIQQVILSCHAACAIFPGLEVIKLEFILRFKIKRVHTCPKAANHFALF